jgi:hypothetical protein
LIIVWGCTIQYYIGDNYCRLWESLLTNQKNAMTSRVVNIVNITIFLSVSHELSLFSMVFLSQSFSPPPFAKQNTKASLLSRSVVEAHLAGEQLGGIEPLNTGVLQVIIHRWAMGVTIPG